MAEMTADAIVASCKANGGYAAPHLNDQLFLHCRGFATIQNLEPYRNVKALWLEQNALSELNGLEGQQDTLVSLLVQNNFIRSLTSLTVALHGLRVLNVSHNYLTSLRGIAAGSPLLETLQASHNQLTSLEVCEELWQLAGTLTSVDLSFNRIETDREPTDRAATASATTATTRAAGDSGCTAAEDDVRIVDAIVPAPASSTLAPHCKPNSLVIAQFFQRLPLVSVIYLQGNGLSHRLRHYRRNMILHLPALTYLDDRPVFPEERRVTEAWGRGGDAAETVERAAIREEKRVHLTQCVTLLTEQREEHRELRDRLTQRFDLRRAQELEELTQRRRRDRDDRVALDSEEAAARTVLEKAEQDARWDAEEIFEEARKALSVTETVHRHAYEQRVAVTAAAQAAAQEALAESRVEDGADSGDNNSEAASAAAAETVRVLEGAAACSSGEFFTRRCRDVTNMVLPEEKASFPPPSCALAELLQSDDDILREMEMEIENVLFDVNSSVDPVKSDSVAHGGDAEELKVPGTITSSRHATNYFTFRMEKNMHAAVDQVSNQLRTQQHQQGRRSSGMMREDVWHRFEQWKARRASQHSAS
ncbi:hypothetical protein JKF63_02435 [Porcisia hertigi]|uniref:Dynein assembly factor 1, axonemal homolog n=1 Tax=Porcisia hertigi TaxID=2761500 RepID=A0A836HR75_9TRYP|nr:hypothetical protein JKF63_02435 [Porcisia hertigi]